MTLYAVICYWMKENYPQVVDFGHCWVTNTLNGTKKFMWIGAGDDTVVIGTYLYDNDRWTLKTIPIVEFIDPDIFNKLKSYVDNAIKILYKAYGKPRAKGVNQ